MDSVSWRRLLVEAVFSLMLCPLRQAHFIRKLGFEVNNAWSLQTSSLVSSVQWLC